VIQTRCRSGLQNLDGWVQFLHHVLKNKLKMRTITIKRKCKR